MPAKIPRTILIYSGGLDSTVCLYHLLALGHHVSCLSFNYGQRHAKELLAAQHICHELGICHEVATLPITRLLSGSSQTDPDIPVPEGHYAAETMKATVVPNRNAIMLSVATAWAISTKAEYVAYAAHAGDHAIYPDCREVFASAMSVVMQLADWHPIYLLRPFVTWGKAAIVARGEELSVPFADTWSCYQGQEIHCGRCGTCCERLEAFDAAHVVDPIEYEDREFWKTANL